MLITLKPPHEDTFTVDIDTSQTVEYFKEKIQKVKGDKFPAKTMKLMYAGKYLVNNKKVSDYSLHEKKFVIVVCEKPKSSIVYDDESESSSDIPERRLAMTIMRHSPDQNHRIGPEYEGLVRHITEIGFTRGVVEAALNANYNNPNRAVEFLINAIVPCCSSTDDSESEAREGDSDHVSDSEDCISHRFSLADSPESPDPSPPTSPEVVEVYPDEMELVQSGAEDNSMSPSDPNYIPQFDTDRPARRSVYQFPSQVFVGNIIRRENLPRAFLTRDGDDDDFLEEDSDNNQSFDEMEEADTYRRSSDDGNTPSPMPSEGTPDSMFSDTMFVTFNNAGSEDQDESLTGDLVDRDHEAIDRLTQLGFSDHKAIEAYLVCERNENAAAEYLFSQNFE